VAGAVQGAPCWETAFAIEYCIRLWYYLGMKRAIIIAAILLSTVSVGHTWSDNICNTQGWSVRYNMQSAGSPATFYVENLTGQAAFKITVMVYFWDYFGNHIGTGRGYNQGPIFQHFTFATRTTDKVHKITATVFNTWEYGQ